MTHWEEIAREQLAAEGIVYHGEDLANDDSPEAEEYEEKLIRRMDEVFDAEIAEAGHWNDGDFDLSVEEVPLGTVYRIEPNGEKVVLCDEAEEKDACEIVFDDSPLFATVRYYIDEDGPTEGLKKYYVEVDNFGDEDKEEAERLKALEWVWVENKKLEGGAQ
jgi:hypothetical protein